MEYWSMQWFKVGLKRKNEGFSLLFFAIIELSIDLPKGTVDHPQNQYKVGRFDVQIHV